MYPVELHGERVLIREFRPEDLATIRVYASDPEVHRYMMWLVDEAADTITWLERVDAWAHEDPRTNYHLAVDFEGAHVGSVHLGLEQNHRECELGYVLRRDLWGRGLIPEATALAIRFGFEELGLQRIYARCDPRNVASQRVMEKACMRREALVLKHLWIANEWRDSLYCAIVRTEWDVFRAFTSAAREDTGHALTVHRAGPAEIAQIHELMVVVGQDMIDRFGMDHWEKPWPLEHMLFDGARRETYAVKDADGIIGSFTVGFDPVWFNESFLPWAPATRPLYLNRLMTHPKYQSSGIGALMMRTAEHLARARGCDVLRLETRTDFDAVRRFYDRIGYILRYEDQQNPWCALDKEL